LRGENATTTGGSATHTHTISATAGVATNALALSGNAAITLANTGHTHTVSGPTPSSTNNPPYITGVFAQLTSAATPPNDLIEMFTGAPPTGWTMVSDVGQPFNGNFVLGGTTYGTAGGSATHTHATTTITSSGPSATILDAKSSGGGALPGATNTHTHDFTFTTDSQSSIPLYRAVVFGKYTAASPTLTQSHYEWFANANSTTPGAALAGLDGTALSVASGTTIRLRVNIGATTNPLSTSSQAFKLQFAIATSGPWTDLGGTTSTVAWRGFDNGSPANGSTIPSNLLASSTASESYVEQNPSPSNPTGIPTGGWGEWDWVIQRGTAPASAKYYFRTVKADGTTLDAYSNYPALTTQTLYQASGTLVSDIIDTSITNGVAPNSVFFEGSMPVNTAVKFQFAAATSTSGSWNYVAWNPVTLSCDTASFYTPTGPGNQVEVKAACHNQKRYIRYKLYLSTTDTSVTPRVDRVILNYAQ
jgi:hypothetical protein